MMNAGGGQGLVSDPTNGSGNPAPPPVKLPASHLAKENLIPIPKEWKESSTRDGKCHRVDVSNTHLRRSIERVRADLSADNNGRHLYTPVHTKRLRAGWCVHACRRCTRRRITTARVATASG